MRPHVSTGLVLAFVLLPLAAARGAERSERKALRVARQVERAMGGRAAWERTRHVRWNFFGRRLHYWDKTTDDVRIEQKGVATLMNLRTRAGRAFVDGLPLAGEELEAALADAYTAWVNDSYWLAMPWKLRDPGVTLVHGGLRALPNGRPADILRLTFADVGPTPQAMYEVWVDQATHLVEQWSFFPTRADERPKFTREFTGWERFGRVLLATRRGGDEDWGIAVFDELPRAIYSDPAGVPAGF